MTPGDVGYPVVFRVLVLLGVLVASALAIVLRRLTQRAQLEEAERVLAEEDERFR